MNVQLQELTQFKEPVQLLKVTYLLPPDAVELAEGQHLSRAEFHQRYVAHPEIKKAELIEGVVYMASPVRMKRHGRPHRDIIVWSGTYGANTPGVWGADNGTFQLDDWNECQPDVVLCLEAEAGGRSWINEADYLEGAPELVIEVAGSSARSDLRTKKQVYARQGVAEYMVVQTVAEKIEWFVLRQGVYEPLLAGQDGVLRSQIFHGLWLDETAFWAGDMKKVLAVLQHGLASAEYLNHDWTGLKD